ncbi:efflux RND transporter permease subunit [Flavitalea sp. BT771]|uniref:efflux RND transporter permease subunit n=1 Tax=Flavitalea sp. BT771 TaxID=3063329 RepID=UPI0026E33FBA|nr:efflux RND transporter permease subunit [Flavitalea sp. BT771]MDO6435505.1 efflux RND transporter permease subunit [Flavitalea sp. BT771]MDV6224405.1 efflux RND transporter permease subunit [Flavitalea sp. BT771]
MRITDFSVKNYQFTLIVFVMLAAIGVNSLLNMPRGEDPDIKAPQFSAIIIYPGTSPKDMEELVVDPIEKRINEMDDIKRIRSQIDDGLAVIQIEFKYEMDPDKKYQDVVRELDAIRPDLPADIQSIKVQKFTPSDVNILQVALVSESTPYKDMEEWSKKLKERLEKIKTLKNVDNWAFPKQQVRVSLNLEKLAQNKIPLNVLLRAMQSENVNIPGGSIEMGARKFNIKTSGDYKNVEEIRNTIVSSVGGRIIYVRDLADVDFNYEEQQYIGRLNGKPAVFVTASRKSGTNIFAVEKEMEPVLEKFRKELPPSIVFEKSFNNAESVHTRLGHFTMDFVIAIFLVLLTLLPLGPRASVVVMISIPLSLAIGLFLLDLFHITINQLSIVGMVVALGLLVDDSIVVVENIERYLRMGYGKKEAAMAATRQIGLAVLGCTATLIFAFLPLMFLPEGAGDFIRSLPAAVVTTVLASLFVSLTIVPFLSSRILSGHEHPDGNFFLRGLKKFINGSYRRLLHAAIGRPVLTLLVALAIFVGCLFLVPVVGFSVFPASEKPMFLVNIETPLGASLPATDSVARWVEQEINHVPDLKNYVTNVGRGNPRIYYNVIPQNEVSNYAQLFIQLKETPPVKKRQLIDMLRKKFKDYPGARIEVKDFEQGPPIEAPIAIRLFSDDLDTLRSLAFRVEDLLKRTSGTLYVKNELTTLKTDIKVKVNKDKAGILGVPVNEIDRTVRLAVAGLDIGKFRKENGDDYNINVCLPRAQRQSLDALDKVYVSAYNGTSIPLSQLADVQFQSSPTSIHHYDKDRYTTVTAFVQNGFNTTRVTDDVLGQLNKMAFPRGAFYKAAGEVESKEESFGGLGTIILITVFGILGILILEFKTFRGTLIVLSVVPLGIIGAVLALLFSGNTFSFVAVIGIIALVGIEVKNSILLVDYTDQLRKNGMGLDEAIQEAGETRFVPIILTTLTAIGGLIPLVAENNPLYSPLALVIIGGLLSSTVLTRVVTPVLYKLLAPRVEVEVAGGEKL